MVGPAPSPLFGSPPTPCSDRALMHRHPDWSVGVPFGAPAWVAVQRPCVVRHLLGLLRSDSRPTRSSRFLNVRTGPGCATAGRDTRTGAVAYDATGAGCVDVAVSGQVPVKRRSKVSV